MPEWTCRACRACRAGNCERCEDDGCACSHPDDDRSYPPVSDPDLPQVTSLPGNGEVMPEAWTVRGRELLTENLGDAWVARGHELEAGEL